MTSLSGLYKLAKRRVILRRVVESQRVKQAAEKRAELPQFDPVPLSSLTARADYIRNKKYKPERNPLTSDEQDLLTRLVAGMSRSRARVVGAHRRGRLDARKMLAETPLWG